MPKEDWEGSLFEDRLNALRAGLAANAVMIKKVYGVDVDALQDEAEGNTEMKTPEQGFDIDTIRPGMSESESKSAVSAILDSLLPGRSAPVVVPTVVPVTPKAFDDSAIVPGMDDATQRAASGAILKALRGN